MAHLQGNNPGDDPTKYGLKFDSEKPRWGLLPTTQLEKVVEVFNMLLPSGESKEYGYLNLKDFDKEVLINVITNRIFSWKNGNKIFVNKRYRTLSIIAFEMFLLLRGKPYTDEELNRAKGCYNRWDLINMKDVEGVVNVYTMGAKKYADNNWQKVSPDRYYDALLRHFNTVRTSNRYDSELGCLHMHQAIWNVLSLMWIEDQIPESIKRVAQKLKGMPPIKVTIPKKKAVKKKVAKKKTAKKKITPVRNPKSGKD